MRYRISKRTDFDREKQHQHIKENIVEIVSEFNDGNISTNEMVDRIESIIEDQVYCYQRDISDIRETALKLMHIYIGKEHILVDSSDIGNGSIAEFYINQAIFFEEKLAELIK